jgi:hypothetical protein
MGDIKLIKSVIKGLITYVPGTNVLINFQKGKTRHSNSRAEFCYNFWLSILKYAKENGIRPEFDKIGEIGTGGSLGIGICALLSGCEKYFAMEIGQNFNKDLNLKILDDLVLLFKNKVRLSDSFNNINLKINDYDYPENLIDPEFLNEKTISEIKNDILNNFKDSHRIIILNEWQAQPSMELDFVFSRAVMEHVSSPGDVYAGITTILKIIHICTMILNFIHMEQQIKLMVIIYSQ